MLSGGVGSSIQVRSSGASATHMAIAVGTFSRPCTSSIIVDVRPRPRPRRLDLDRLPPLFSVHFQVGDVERSHFSAL